MSDARERFEAKTKSGYPPKFEEFCRTNGIPLDCVSVPRMAAWSAWQAAERDALERAAKELHGRLMRGDVELGEAYLRLKSVGVPPTEAEFLSFIRALAGQA